MSTRSIINKEPVDIIIPTFDNLHQLLQCIQSMYKTRNQYPIRFIIINNGNIPLEQYIPADAQKDFVIVSPGKNLGWTGGIAEGLKHSTSKYVMFANDDIFVPISSFRWLSQMVRHLVLKPNVAAVGPSTNCAMGVQNIFSGAQFACFTSLFLIGFCILVRRSTLDEVGGIDETFNTGDDIDLSMRFTKAGYYMMVDATIFIWHHGFQTGVKVYGDHNHVGGWNSQKMTDDTNIALIKKHGFKEWWYLRRGYPADYPMKALGDIRHENEIVGRYVNGTDPKKIVDLGCGGSKTVPGSVGVDILPNGYEVANTPYRCEGDIMADVQKPLPFEDESFEVVIARHILEHCTDIIAALEEWKRIMTHDGKMIICVPDERISDTIILNPEHVHAFTPEALIKIVERVGFVVDAQEDFYMDDSFTLVLSKAPYTPHFYKRTTETREEAANV